MARQVQYNNQVIDVPDDATDDEISTIIEVKDAESKSKPFEPGLVERAGRYLADWGQGMRDAFSAPGGGPTGIPLVDAAAGAADAALTFGTGIVDPFVQIPRTLADRALGGNTPYSENAGDLVWEPKTPVGKGIIGAAGSVIKPAGDAAALFGKGAGAAAGVAGLSPQTQQDIEQMIPDVAMSALDIAGLRAAKGTKAVGNTAAVVTPNRAPVTPDPVGLRPFGPEVEQARRLDYRVLPSQAKAKAQLNAPVGTFGPSVPGTFREAFVGPDFHTQAIIDNQKRTNNFAAKELGISELSQQGLALAKNPHNAVFNEVARSLPYVRRDAGLEEAANALGAARRDNPYLKTTSEVENVRDRLLSADVVPTQKALDAIREFRKDANRLYQKVGDVEAEQAAAAYRGAADALEAALERQAGVLNPDLIPRLRDARTALAKIHNVEDAMVGNNLDPQKLLKIGEKFPLSGYLKDIADVAQNFPDTMRVATGRDMEIQSQQGVLNSLRLATQRALGHEQGTGLLTDPFQRRLGAADPNYDPRPAPSPAGPSPIVDYTPPSPDAPGGAPVMPPGPVTNLPADLGVVDPMANFDQLPPAAARPGDLTASTPPVGGTLPAQDLGLAEALAGPIDLAPPTRGDLPYDPRNPPANPPDDMGLVENAPPPFPRNGPATPGVELPGPLDEDMAGLGIPPGGALPFVESVGAPPVVQTRPEAMRVGQSLSEGMDLVPEPVPNPDVLPPPPDMGGGLDFAPRVEPGADVIDFTPEMIDPESLAGIFELLQSNNGVDFPLGDLQLGGRGRTLNPERRNMPRAGGRGTRGDELSLSEDLVDEPPLALPAPDPLRATEGGMVGTPQQFDELGLGTPGARAAAEGDYFPAGEGPTPQGERPIADELSLADDGGRGGLPTDFNAIETTLSEGAVKLGDGDVRSIVIKPFDGRMRIQQTDVAPDMQKRGYNRQNIKDALDYAQKQGMPLDSDVSFTRKAWDSWKSALDSGVFEGDLDRAAIEAAMERGGGVAANPSGEPWIKNIRLGPAG